MVTPVSGNDGPIRVPEWYARFSRTAVHEPSQVDETVRLGPITVFNPGRGVEIATFGNPDNPGVVLLDGYLFDRNSLRQEVGVGATAEPALGANLKVRTTEVRKAADPGVWADLKVRATDAAIAAAAYERWGEKIFDRLDGSYLLAVWDPGPGRLFLGHDALGHHPVFYAHSRSSSSSSDALWFGSNVLTLSASGQISNRANRVSLALAALTQWPEAGQTFFESIRRLRPGYYLTVDGDQVVHEHHYWSAWMDDDEREMTPREVTDQFESELMAAVTRCMELNPQGIMLSGGLDSVTIAALAAEHSKAHGGGVITAVSGRRDYPPTNEEPAQNTTVAALGMPHLVAKESEWTGHRNEIDLSLDVVAELPGPSRVYWVGAYMAFYRHTAARDVNVLLTGSGGDNWVAVGDAYAAECMRSMKLAALNRFVRSYVNTGGLSAAAAARHLLWSGGVRVLLDAFGARWLPGVKSRYHKRTAYAGLPDWITPDRSLRDELVDTLLRNRPPALTPHGRLPRNFYRHAQRAGVNHYYQYEFETGFHIESACGLRLLSPYHDRRLVRFLNRIPPEVLLTGGRYKGLLRPVAERRLPGLGLKHQRKNYAPGVLTAQMNDLRQGILNAWPKHECERLGQLGVVDLATLRRTLNPTSNAAFPELFSMYALLSAERWVGVHIRR